jgi:hypothetical protein
MTISASSFPVSKSLLLPILGFMAKYMWTTEVFAADKTNQEFLDFFGETLAVSCSEPLGFGTVGYNEALEHFDEYLELGKRCSTALQVARLFAKRSSKRCGRWSGTTGTTSA